MAVNINNLKTDMKNVQKIYKRFTTNFYDKKTDQEYFRDYAKMERDVENLVKKLVDARTKISEQISTSGLRVMGAEQSNNASRIRAAKAKQDKFIDEERVIERMIDEIEQIRVSVWRGKTR